MRYIMHILRRTDKYTAHTILGSEPKGFIHLHPKLVPAPRTGHAPAPTATHSPGRLGNALG